jgi:DnaJ-class molecular chaperone
VTRIAVVTAVLLALVVLVRFFVIPASYFSRELHEAATVRRETVKPISFAGAATCAECHEEEADRKSKGYHRGLACETCHGPSAKHAEEPTEVKPFAPRERKFCPLCHAYDSARPTGFPQINPIAHNPLRPCITCHDPHDPVPPEPPRECSACHAQIDRTKALSSHALLPCATCHPASDQHKISPRSALPAKPQAREFCGQCHATGSAEERAPKVDLAAHGSPYLCWQCHYPHLPEGRQ